MSADTVNYLAYAWHMWPPAGLGQSMAMHIPHRLMLCPRCVLGSYVQICDKARPCTFPVGSRCAHAVPRAAACRFRGKGWHVSPAPELTHDQLSPSQETQHKEENATVTPSTSSPRGPACWRLPPDPTAHCRPGQPRAGHCSSLLLGSRLCTVHCQGLQL